MQYNLCNLRRALVARRRVDGNDKRWPLTKSIWRGPHFSWLFFKPCLFQYVVKTILINFCTRNFAINMIECGRIDATYEIIVTARCLVNYLWNVYFWTYFECFWLFYFLFSFCYNAFVYLFMPFTHLDFLWLLTMSGRHFYLTTLMKSLSSFLVIGFMVFYTLVLWISPQK